MTGLRMHATIHSNHLQQPSTTAAVRVARALLQLVDAPIGFGPLATFMATFSTPLSAPLAPLL